MRASCRGDLADFFIRSGELKIAEVTSRFTNLDAFIALINTIGFRLLRKVRFRFRSSDERD